MIRPLSTEPLSAHRRLRGPYTLGGALARAFVPEALDAVPELVRRHETAVLSMAPELREAVGATKETLTSLAVPSERTRFYSRLRTLRLAHGLAELLRDTLAKTGGPRRLVVRDAEHADQTDAELLEVLRRRVPAELLVIVEDESRPVPDTSAMDATARAALFVASECLHPDPALREAYEDLDESERTRLHADRLAELAATGEFSWRLGAIPFHAERIGPAEAVPALRTALDHCIDMGFYEATVDFGHRGRRYVSADDDLDDWWAFTTKMTTSLAALGRPEQAEGLYVEARAASTNPSVHHQAAYATAMLYTRHHDPEKRDHRLAKGWINEAIAIASLMPDKSERAFRTAFYRNGLALIELHLGDPARALELVEDGLRRLDAELSEDAHRLHRSVLHHNRAQVLAGLGRRAEALADYDHIIAVDPNYPEYHFDRAGLLRRLGRVEEALDGYDTAIRLSPTFPEAYVNRATLRAEAGDLGGAIEDLVEATELEPDNVDAHVSLGELLLEDGRPVAAERAARQALTTDPHRAEPHVLLGRIAAEEDPPAAMASFDRALALDPDLLGARTARAELAYGLGDLTGALADLDLAVAAHPGDPAVLFNRAVVLLDLGATGRARTDLLAAALEAPDDPDIAAALAGIGDTP